MTRREHDPVQHALYMREWRARNSERDKANMVKWRKENRARLLVYAQEHRVERKASKHAYIARKRGAEGRYTAEEFRQLVALYGGKCAYCGKTGPMEADHVIPLSRGGANGIENILPACRSCNGRKADKTADEFATPGSVYPRMARIERPPEGHKACSVCKRVLPFSSYWKDRSHPLGIQSTCKECGYAKHKSYVATPEGRAKRRASANAWWSKRMK